MKKSEILELLRKGERSEVVLLKDTIDALSLAREIVSLINSRGGQVILGVESDGYVAGITRPDLEEWVMTACQDKIIPEVIPYYEEIHDVEPGKHVAVVRVDRGWAVHHVWHANHRTYYIRVGSQSREASPEELERLFQQRGAFRLETRSVSGATLNDLDLRRLRDYFQRIRSQETPSDEDVDGWQALLVNTEILSDEGGTTAPTVAGLLLFGKNPNRFLPQAGIDAVAYPGREKDYTAKERLPIRGPMVPLTGSQGLVENGLVEQTVEFIKRNTGVETNLKNGVRREDRWTYPEEAIRETIVNALVHRDYLLSGSDIELAIYENRLEVGSPGRLPNGITPQRMLSGCRAARNQLLKDFMRDYGYLEHMGMGIPRKIVKSMQAHNGTLPELIEEEERFIIRLLNP
ncbi:MAG TPA: ATP-dependent DNA helicase RecG [Deltaproteobacteria bacterium]|nr:ATP-dependent DNA helicase RecG [Deltaproteobacteria bacterium]